MTYHDIMLIGRAMFTFQAIQLQPKTRLSVPLTRHFQKFKSYTNCTKNSHSTSKPSSTNQPLKSLNPTNINHFTDMYKLYKNLKLLLISHRNNPETLILSHFYELDTKLNFIQKKHIWNPIKISSENHSNPTKINVFTTV